MRHKKRQPLSDAQFIAEGVETVSETAFDCGADVRTADADIGKASVIERAQFGHGAAIADIVTNGLVKFHFDSFL